MHKVPIWAYEPPVACVRLAVHLLYVQYVLTYSSGARGLWLDLCVSMQILEAVCQTPPKNIKIFIGIALNL
jgi:hypothetical protein